MGRSHVYIVVQQNNKQRCWGESVSELFQDAKKKKKGKENQSYHSLLKKHNIQKEWLNFIFENVPEDSPTPPKLMPLGADLPTNSISQSQTHVEQHGP